MTGPTYTKRKLVAVLLCHFESNRSEWLEALSIFFYLDIADRDAKRAVECATQTMEFLEDKAIPFDAVKFYGMNGTDPQVELLLGMMPARAALLAGVDEDGTTYVLSGIGSIEDRKEAKEAIAKEAKQAA